MSFGKTLRCPHLPIAGLMSGGRRTGDVQGRMADRSLLLRGSRVRDRGRRTPNLTNAASTKATLASDREAAAADQLAAVCSLATFPCNGRLEMRCGPQLWPSREHSGRLCPSAVVVLSFSRIWTGTTTPWSVAVPRWTARFESLWRSQAASRRLMLRSAPTPGLGRCGR